MPDHVHFFCRAELDARPLRIFIQKWKEWTSKRITREIAVAGIDDPGLNESRTLWREEFLIMSCARARATARKGVRERELVRAGLVEVRRLAISRRNRVANVVAPYAARPG
jgi:hypothetical protein